MNYEERDEEVETLADAIVGGGSPAPKAEGTGLEEGSASIPAEADPGEIAATEEVIAAFDSKDPVALNEALKAHYEIAFNRRK